MALKPLTKFRKVSHVVLAKTVKLLLTSPATAHEVAEHTGLHLVTAQEWMRSLRKEGAVHISGWLADSLGRDVTAVYTLGPGNDKPRHKFTTAERTARYRERKQKAARDRMILGFVNHTPCYDSSSLTS
jgi:hypothetical protein